MFLWWKSDLINLPWHYLFSFQVFKTGQFPVCTQSMTNITCLHRMEMALHIKREKSEMFGRQCGSQSIKISLQPRSANLILKVTPSDTERSLCVFLQPVPQMLHLCSDATLSCASRGAVLLHTAPVVPHWGHVTSKQRAEGTEQTKKRQR